MAFVNKEGEFTGCHCGNCADAMISAQKVLEEALQMNENCTVWALMLAEAMVTTAKAVFVSTGAKMGVEMGHHPAQALASSFAHIEMIKKAMQKVMMSEEGTKATHALILRAMGADSDAAFVTLDDILKPKGN